MAKVSAERNTKPQVERGVYKHTKTGDIYCVEDVLKDAENTNNRGYIVLYRNVQTSERYVRSVQEFLPRFTKEAHATR